MFKILPDGIDLKPQGKHLATRADYLLKVLKKNSSQENGGVLYHKHIDFELYFMIYCYILDIGLRHTGRLQSRNFSLSS